MSVAQYVECSLCSRLQMIPEYHFSAFCANYACNNNIVLGKQEPGYTYVLVNCIKKHVLRAKETISFVDCDHCKNRHRIYESKKEINGQDVYECESFEEVMERLKTELRIARSENNDLKCSYTAVYQRMRMEVLSRELVEKKKKILELETRMKVTEDVLRQMVEKKNNEIEEYKRSIKELKRNLELAEKKTIGEEFMKCWNDPWPSQQDPNSPRSSETIILENFKLKREIEMKNEWIDRINKENFLKRREMNQELDERLKMVCLKDREIEEVRREAAVREKKFLQLEDDYEGVLHFLIAMLRTPLQRKTESDEELVEQQQTKCHCVVERKGCLLEELERMMTENMKLVDINVGVMKKIKELGVNE